MYHQEPHANYYQPYGTNYDSNAVPQMSNTSPMMPDHPQMMPMTSKSDQMPMAAKFKQMPMGDHQTGSYQPQMPSQTSLMPMGNQPSSSAYMPMPSSQTGYGSFPSCSNDQSSRKRHHDDFQQGYGTVDTPATKQYCQNGANDTGSSGYQSSFGSPPSSNQSDMQLMPATTPNMHQTQPNHQMSTPNWAANPYAQQMPQMTATNAQMTQMPAIKAEANKENDDRNIRSLELVALSEAKTVFTTFAARLQLLNSSKKLDVSVAEVKRRIHGPEGFNHSILSAFCRKAKNRDGSERVSQDLAKHGLHIPSGHRKRLRNSCFTALCEMEAIQLVTDHRQVDKTDFPLNALIYEIFNQMTSMQEYYAKYHQYRSVGQTACLWQILIRDNSPLVTAEEEQPLRHHHMYTQENQTKFVNITHGYGNVAMVHSWTMLNHIANLVMHVYNDPLGYCNSIMDQLPVPLIFHMIFAAQNQPQMMQNQYMGYMGQKPQTAETKKTGQNQQMMYPNQMNPNPQMMQNQQMQWPQTF